MYLTSSSLLIRSQLVFRASTFRGSSCLCLATRAAGVAVTCSSSSSIRHRAISSARCIEAHGVRFICLPLIRQPCYSLRTRGAQRQAPVLSATRTHLRLMPELMRRFDACAADMGLTLSNAMQQTMTEWWTRIEESAPQRHRFRPLLHVNARRRTTSGSPDRSRTGGSVRGGVVARCVEVAGRVAGGWGFGSPARRTAGRRRGNRAVR